MKWDLRKVAVALIFRDYSLAHQGLLRLPQTPQPFQALGMQEAGNKAPRKKKALLSSCCRLLWIKAAVSPFHAIPGSSLSPSRYKSRRSPSCQMQNIYHLHKPTEVRILSHKKLDFYMVSIYALASNLKNKKLTIE